MIAKLKGMVDSSGDDWAVIDVAGVGYLVFASRRTLANLPGRGEAAELLIETHVREDHIHLFAFLDVVERDLFRLLLSVQGVGAKMALAVQSALEPGALQTAIAAGDKAALSKAHKIGPKIAQRITNELKEKIGALPSGLAPAAPGVAVQEDSNFQDAVSALVNLGYGRSEAYSAIASARRKLGPVDALDELVRTGLKELAA